MSHKPPLVNDTVRFILSPKPSQSAGDLYCCRIIHQPPQGIASPERSRRGRLAISNLWEREGQGGKGRKGMSKRGCRGRGRTGPEVHKSRSLSLGMGRATAHGGSTSEGHWGDRQGPGGPSPRGTQEAADHVQTLRNPLRWRRNKEDEATSPSAGGALLMLEVGLLRQHTDPASTPVCGGVGGLLRTLRPTDHSRHAPFHVSRQLPRIAPLEGLADKVFLPSGCTSSHVMCPGTLGSSMSTRQRSHL